MDIGKRITFFKDKKGMTTNKLANLSGISQSFLRDIELGKKNPSLETLSLLCDILGITLKDFFDDNSPYRLHSDGLEEIIFRLTPEQRIKLAEFLKSIWI